MTQLFSKVKVKFFYWYRNYHGYVAIAVCILGIVANSANIVVLTRPSMRSPINYILSALLHE